MVNKEQILGIIRHILTFGGGWLVASGALDEVTVANGVGALVTIIGIVWSAFFAPEKKLPAQTA